MFGNRGENLMIEIIDLRQKSKFRSHCVDRYTFGRFPSARNHFVDHRLIVLNYDF